MAMYFGEKKIQKVVFIDKPDAVFTPLKMLTDADQKLDLFKWLIVRKPASREELIAKLLGSLKAPVSNFVYMLDALAKQKEEQDA